MSTNIAIWGTGRIGSIAYYYYKDSCNILYYIDNDARKWGKVLNGIKICSPDILKNVDVMIVLAIKWGIEDVKKQIEIEYRIKKVTIFAITQEHYSIEKEPKEVQKNMCIVNFIGGLGNQMFQYAFLKNLQYNGKKVLAYLDSNVGTANFCLLNVFKNIHLEICTKEQKKVLIEKNVNEEEKTKKFMLYTEDNIYETKEKRTDMSILDVTGGVFSGLFQTYKFAEQVKDELMDDFKFHQYYDSKLDRLYEIITSYQAVSIHIRRGDYLLGNNKWIYGDICTDAYYKNAIAYLKNRIGTCKFIFFSNDIKWVKKHYDIDGAIYIDKKMFDHYQDWYDMYLMSVCKHNIIANSTFSWWGAWLNKNKEKIVIAPKRWINFCDYRDIYPNCWIKI